MLLAASILALSLVSEPSNSCIAPTQTGVFRITATTKDSSNASVGLILLENVNNCLEASIVAEDAGPAIIEKIALSQNMLTGRVHMRGGIADVSLRISPEEISGSIINGKKSWLVSGVRTTGLGVRSADGDVAAAPTKTP
ncbi:MAG TPA: hypothetical protein VGM82_01645 [Gemmatimonadaceae bacterium]|jgi:hypothetical protein